LRRRSTKKPSEKRYGGITLLGGKSPPNDVHASLCFHLKLRASHLLVAPYSDYQEFLYQTISKHLEMGWNYQQSTDWLNDNGYTTPRGKRFGNAHTHSIVKNQNIDTTTIVGELFFNIINSIAQYELQLTRERIVSGLEKLLDGKPI